MGRELFPERSENLHILMRLSTPENLIVVNDSKTHVSGKWSVPITSVGLLRTCHLKRTLVEGTEELL